MTSMARSIVAGPQATGPSIRLYSRAQALPWNPISKLAMISKQHDMHKASVQCANKAKRNPFVVYANSVPGVPLPSGPPPSKSNLSWILGFVVTFVLPFFTNKMGPLWVLKNKVGNAVQEVEHIVEAVEHVAEEVDKIAENIAHDLPQGKLRDLVEAVEHMAERAAKTADCIDDVIDQVQEAEDQVEDMVEALAKETKNSPKQEKDQSQINRD